MPYQLGWGYMMPVDVLNGFFIGWLFFLVIMPPVYVALGLIEPAGPGDVTLAESAYNIIPDKINFATNPNLINSFHVGINGGLIIGLAIWPLLLHRDLIAKILKGMFKEPDKTVDPNRPIKYQYVWAMVIISCIVLLSAMVYVMVPASFAIPTLILDLLIMTGFTRFVAETGSLWWYIGGPALSRITYLPGSAIGFVTGLWQGTAYETDEFAALLFTADGSGHNWLGMMQNGEMISLNGFKMGHSFNIRPKDIFVAVLIGTVISFIGITIGHMLFFATHSITKTEIVRYPEFQLGFIWPGGAPGHRVGWGQPGQVVTEGIHSRFGYLADAAHLQPYLIWVVIGFILAGLIPMLRRKLPILRISVAGLLLGANFGIQLWFPFLIGYILKTLTLRIGGGRLYRERGLPLALGAFVGVAAAALPTVLIQTIGFYIITHSV